MTVTLIEVAMWVVLVAISIWMLGPVVGFFWKGLRIEFEVYEGPLLARPYPEDADGLRRYQELLDLGYAPVGSTYERAWFFSPLHWRWRSRGLRWLVSPDGRTFVHLHRLVDDEPMRMGAVTHFEGGGSWRTACPGVLGGVPPVPGHGRADLLSVGPGELLERHAAYVDAFARENGVAPKGVTLAELAQVNATYERAALPKMGMGQMASLPISMGAICLFLGGLALVRSGEARIGALGGAVFMGLFYLVIRHGVLNIARGHVARHMHTRAFQLEQTAVAADGTIATGRYERWLRLLAVVAALDVAARLVVIAWKIVQNFPFSGGGAFVFAALIVALNVIVLRELVARAKGRVVTLGAKPSSVGAWSSWSTAALLFSVGVRTMPHVLMGWLVVVFVLSVLGRALEKRGRT